MALRGWKVATNDLTLLLLGMQDAAYAAYLNNTTDRKE